MALGDRAKEFILGMLWFDCKKDALRDLEELQAENAKLKKPSFAKMTEEAKQHRHYWIEKCKWLENDRKALQSENAKSEANVAVLLEALDGITTVAEIVLKEGSVRGPLSLRGWCHKSREAIAKVKGKP